MKGVSKIIEVSEDHWNETPSARAIYTNVENCKETGDEGTGSDYYILCKIALLEGFFFPSKFRRSTDNGNAVNCRKGRILRAIGFNLKF